MKAAGHEFASLAPTQKVWGRVVHICNPSVGEAVNRNRQISGDHWPNNLAISVRDPTSKNKAESKWERRSVLTHVYTNTCTQMHTCAPAHGSPTSAHAYTIPTWAVKFQHVFWREFLNCNIFIFTALTFFISWDVATPCAFGVSEKQS